MARSVSAVLREIALVRASKDLSDDAKDVVISGLKHEMDKMTRQQSLDLRGGEIAPATAGKPPKG